MNKSLILSCYRNENEIYRKQRLCKVIGYAAALISNLLPREETNKGGFSAISYLENLLALAHDHKGNALFVWKSKPNLILVNSITNAWCEVDGSEASQYYLTLPLIKYATTLNHIEDTADQYTHGDIFNLLNENLI